MAKGENNRDIQTRRVTLTPIERLMGQILLSHALSDIAFIAGAGFSPHDIEAIQSLRKKLAP